MKIPISITIKNGGYKISNLYFEFLKNFGQLLVSI